MHITVGQILMGLLKALTDMLEEVATGSNLSRKATLLMAEILQMANRVLPLSVAAEIQVRGTLFAVRQTAELLTGCASNIRSCGRL